MPPSPCHLLAGPPFIFRNPIAICLLSHLGLFRSYVFSSHFPPPRHTLSDFSTFWPSDFHFPSPFLRLSFQLFLPYPLSLSAFRVWYGFRPFWLLLSLLLLLLFIFSLLAACSTVSSRFRTYFSESCYMSFILCSAAPIPPQTFHSLPGGSFLACSPLLSFWLFHRSCWCGIAKAI